MDALLAGSFRAAIYCRLSKDDDLQGESASIANQRDTLEKFCEKQGWEVAAVYQDDGFTGLNMERPDLKRMLKAIERKQINLVITKDLSRLGRNYLQTGQLIEDFFPRNGVRYIAMNDGIDTMRDNNDIAPFKNILNEMYSKDISKKVHSSYVLKAQKGQFTGCLAPFGYRKDPENKNRLLVDEETAPVVRLIFGYALDGHGPNYIRRRLEEEKHPCPTWWNRKRGHRNIRTKWEKKDPENGKYIWDFSVIKEILMNPVYTGAVASQKTEYRFKIGTIRDKKPEDWIVVEGTHEPLVDKKSFVIEKNNLHDLDTWIFFKWIFKTFVAVLLVTNTWNIVMGVFDITQSVVNDSAGVIISDTSIDIATVITDIEAKLDAMSVGGLLGLWFQSLFVGLTMKALSICIMLVVYGRMIEIYLVTSIAPIPVATMVNREWGGMGQNYLKSLLALGFQAFLILVCVGIYAVLIQTIAATDDISGAIWSCMGYTVLLCFTLFKTGSLAKSVFSAH